jgi:hypothetical protein
LDAEGAGWGGYDLMELRAIKRRHIDVLMALEERFIRL